MHSNSNALPKGCFTVIPLRYLWIVAKKLLWTRPARCTAHGSPAACFESQEGRTARSVSGLRNARSACIYGSAAGKERKNQHCGVFVFPQTNYDAVALRRQRQCPCKIDTKGRRDGGGGVHICWVRLVWFQVSHVQPFIPNIDNNTSWFNAMIYIHLQPANIL